MVTVYSCLQQAAGAITLVTMRVPTATIGLLLLIQTTRMKHGMLRLIRKVYIETPTLGVSVFLSVLFMEKFRLQE